MADDLRPFALVTGASSGIGFELARQFAEHGFDLLLAADEPAVVEAADACRRLGVEATPLEADLATEHGVRRVYEHAVAGGRPIDALAANAGIGLGGAFFEQDFDQVVRVIETNVTGTLRLVQLVGRDMRERGRGRILVTGSIAGLMPGSFSAVYNGTKAFLDSFAAAIRDELKDTGVTVTCLMPGPTESEFFERAGLEDTKVAREKKSAPADVAKAGFEAMMRGDAEVTPGMMSKLRAAAASILPDSAVAEQHRGLTGPGSRDERR